MDTSKTFMIKSIFLPITIIIIGVFSSLFMFADEISKKLTDNLNRNLDVNWGVGHPKFKKKNMIVDVLDMSVRWDDFKIIFPNTQTSDLRNSLSEISMDGCKSNVSFFLKLQIFVKCKIILIKYSNNKWSKKDDLRISRTFFFERRIFDDLYDKQGRINVKISTEKIIFNNKNLEQFTVEYSFIDEENLQLLINDEEVLLTKKQEGLIIKTSEHGYFFLNQNFFKNTIDRLDSEV